MESEFSNCSIKPRLLVSVPSGWSSRFIKSANQQVVAVRSRWVELAVGSWWVGLAVGSQWVGLAAGSRWVGLAAGSRRVEVAAGSQWVGLVEDTLR